MHDNHGFLWPMFWGLFALAIIMARRFTRHRERMKALEMTQRYIESGVTPPDILTKALDPEDRVPKPAETYVLGGLINIAVAVAMVILGVVLSMGSTGKYQDFAAPHPLFGIAAFPALIGLVLLIFGVFARKKL
jgi:hypothetical protein